MFPSRSARCTVSPFCAPLPFNDLSLPPALFSSLSPDKRQHAALRSTTCCDVHRARHTRQICHKYPASSRRLLSVFPRFNDNRQPSSRRVITAGRRLARATVPRSVNNNNKVFFINRQRVRDHAANGCHSLTVKEISIVKPRKACVAAGSAPHHRQPVPP